MKKTFLFLILAFIPLLMNATPYEITANTTETWDSNNPPPYDPFTDDIIIHQGATLNIIGVIVHIQTSKKIIVERNAKLIINGSTITKDTQGGRWAGIRCDNGSAQVQSTDRIPYVRIMNNSTISFADIAFMNSDIDYATGGNYGGAILASESDFLNNENFIVIRNYVYNQKTYEYCQFILCNFIEAYQCYINKRFIVIEDADGIIFRGCTFSYHCDTHRTAIRADNSKFSIYKYYNYITQQEFDNYFTGFSDGVYINNGNTGTKAVTIADCHFDGLDQYDPNCNVNCIWVEGCYNPQILSNTCNSLQGTATYYNVIFDKTGIKIVDCPHLYVEGNIINYSGTQQQTWGIYISNSEISTNQIYRNEINNAKYGILADGKNRGQVDDPTFPDQGLKFLCNELNSYDDAYYFITTNCNNSNPAYGVSKYQQGAIINDYDSPNYNSTPNRSLSSCSQYDFLNEHTSAGPDIIYKTPSNPGDFTIHYYTSSIAPSPNSNYSPTTSHCESRLPCFGRNCPVDIAPLAKPIAYSGLSTLLSDLDDLVNAGDHDYLYNLVSEVSEQNLTEVYSALMNSNPSYDILAIACAIDLFTPQMIENILVENSYGIKSNAVRGSLESRESQLSSEQMENIYEAAESISTYEDLMYQVDYINQEYSFYMNQSITALANRDTIPMDSIKLYLEAIGDILSIIKLIEISFNENDIEYADELFDNIENSTDDQDEIDDYTDLYSEVLYDIYSNHDGDFTQMDEDQVDVLFDLWDNGTYASGIAKYLLSKYKGYDWELIICTDEYYTNYQSHPEIKPKANNTDVNNAVKIYPNPANTKLNIELTACNYCNANIIITDLSGRNVICTKINQVNNQISVTNLAEGTYILRVITNNNTNITKFVIQK